LAKSLIQSGTLSRVPPGPWSKASRGKFAELTGASGPAPAAGTAPTTTMRKQCGLTSPAQLTSRAGEPSLTSTRWGDLWYVPWPDPLGPRVSR